MVCQSQVVVCAQVQDGLSISYRNVCLLRPLNHTLSLKQAGLLNFDYLFLQITLYLPVHLSPLSVINPIFQCPQARLVQSKITLPVWPEIIASRPSSKSV